VDKVARDPLDAADVLRKVVAGREDPQKSLCPREDCMLECHDSGSILSADASGLRARPA
jgi:hypothetical protein